MYNSNCCGINTIIIATLVALIISNCMGEDGQDRWGNILLLVGQILVTLPTVEGKCCCNREVNPCDNFNGYNY